jgi:hypothetical protein
MKMKILTCFLVFVISLTGCTHRLMGKKIPRHYLSYYSQFEKTVKLGHDCIVTHRVRDNQLVGSLFIKKIPGASEWDQLFLIVLFADKNYIVRAKSSYSWTRADNIYTGFSANFAIDIPKEPYNLMYVAFEVRGQYTS